MSGSVQFHTPEVRLGKLLREPGGKKFTDAMADAGAGLESLRAECLASLSGTLDQAEAVAAQANGAFDPKVVAELYKIVSGPIGAPSACGLHAIDTMLTSLSDLLDYLQVQQTWEANAVMVHLRAFRLLLHTEGARDGEGGKAILEGLMQVSRRFARPVLEPKKA
jgi:hypothetical protein